ncbi:hypothetical protein F53441_7925 [Fusarium austroafricanum]|uniref:GED domain-containing protein n=1 Tax=Fusarium austroafricanum TaxID=2364996 RepID=A0A8H4KEN1_9HYPO|nr:hypothetical protein F53441_7925 [Fusarium austroafricanum]
MTQPTLTSPDRLRKIDQLRERNLAAYLPLPQLVAVGDQSSGKSSLLGNRSFALAMSPKSLIVVMLCRASLVDANASKKINVLMDIKTARNPDGNKTFAEDVLKIERCGPDEDYLTVIDVPGIFRSKTEGVTTERDCELVAKMVKKYIRDSQTVILAVLPSNVDVATQEILTFAEEVDKTGERPLGILTKPDLVKERSGKAVVCNLVLGKRRPLTLGYHLVRSRGGDDEDLDGEAASYEREEIFKEDPWTSLPAHRVGIEALLERLQELLGQITDKAYPKLRSQARRMLTEKQEELAGLGPSPQTERQQQQYLAGNASSFQSMVRAALDADYSAHDVFDNDDLRLVTRVVNITEEFSASFEARSHAYAFGEDLAAESQVSLHDTVEGNFPKQASPTPMSLSSLFALDDEEKEVEDCDENYYSGLYPDLDGVLARDWSRHNPARGIMDWIAEMYRRSRGVELGTFGPRILSSAFQEQSINWHNMTHQYMSRVIVAVHKFILGAFEGACTDPRVRSELTSGIMSELLDRYRAGMSHATYLVDVERQKKPYTLNHYFNNSLQIARGNRICHALKGKGWREKNQRLVVAVDDVSSIVSYRSNAEHTAEDIHDILQAYYKVARKRFVDNVYHQAVDHGLLSGPSNPLGLSCEQWVLQLEAEKLRTIAGDSRITQERRICLEKSLEDLEEAMKILG